MASGFAGEVTGWSWLSSVSGGLVVFVIAIVPLFALIGWWLWHEPEQLDEGAWPIRNGFA